MSVKSKIRKLVPYPFLSAYHFALAYAAAIRYKFPSKKMIVIGITGTKGKTSSANFIWSCLNANGYKVGLIGTANIRIGDKELMNQYHMTMPGRFKLQSLMSQMVEAGCKYCIMEVTSEGIKQHRHKGIVFDFVVFTNLTPEHLTSHGGSFEKYRAAKGKLFSSLKNSAVKTINGQKVAKVIVINNDSPEKNYFSKFPADKKITYGIKKKADFQAEDILNSYSGIDFTVRDIPYKLNILGEFNIYNALPAIIVANELGVLKNRIQRGLSDLDLIPGRMEKINEGQNFTLIVDYAHEKESITAVLNTARSVVGKKGRVIILMGAEGGGRDKAKRPIMGKLAGKMADYVIVSNVDPYEDDPMEIAEDIAKASEKEGKIRDKNLFVIEDRRKGINKTLSLARHDDIVLITGKGAEQSIVIGGKKKDWDDRVVVREELKKIINKK